MQELDPIGIMEGGSAAAFDLTEYQQAMSGQSKSYKATCNFSWVDPRYSTSPGVPVLKSGIWKLAMANYINRSTLKPLTLVIAMKDNIVDPRTMKGALLSVNPPEEILAAYHAIDYKLEEGMTDDQVKTLNNTY